MDTKASCILHLTNVMDIGGVQKIIYELCDGTKEEFEKVVVASTGGYYADKIENLGIEHVIIPDLSTKNIKNIIKLKNILSKIVNENKINVIHCHHRMAVFYAKLWFNNLKIIYNNHTIYSDKRLLSKIVLNKVYIVADGVQAKNNLTEYFKLPDNNITIINNAVDKFDGNFSEINEISSARDSNNFIVLNCSRLHPQKGVQYFIEAADILKKKKLHISFFIVGDGPLKKELCDMVKEKNLEEYVKFMGFRKDVKNTIKNCDILVQTSIYEGLPLTPMEAFSVGKTVVATDIDGTREVVHDRINGLLAETKNSDSIAEKIELLYNNRKLLHDLEEGATISFEKEFCSDVMIKKYINFYSSL